MSNAPSRTELPQAGPPAARCWDVTAQPHATPPSTARLTSAARDVVFVFGFTSWSGAVARELTMPEDRLADALTRHRRVRRLLVCDPFRSLPRKLIRDLVEPPASFPRSSERALHQPLRLRRFDPTDLRAAQGMVSRYERGMRRAAGRLGLERPAVISTHPLVAAFGGFEWAGPVTYFAWDDWSASRPHERWWDVYEHAYEAMRAGGRRVCAVSEPALRRVAPTGPSAVVPNGVEPLEWERLESPPAWFAARPRPRMLYVGTLDDRIDVEQARAVAAAYPDGSLTFVGDSVAPAHLGPLRSVPNIVIRPRAPRAEVVRLIGAADCCLIPHRRTPLTEAMSPLKLYEYLAGGRPVAAVDLPGIAGVDARVELAATGAELVPAVARALARGPMTEAERRRFVLENGWAHRIDSVIELALAPVAATS